MRAYHQALYHQAPYHQAPYHQAPYHQALYHQALYHQAPYHQALYHQALPGRTDRRPVVREDGNNWKPKQRITGSAWSNRPKAGGTTATTADSRLLPDDGNTLLNFMRLWSPILLDFL